MRAAVAFYCCWKSVKWVVRKGPRTMKTVAASKKNRTNSYTTGIHFSYCLRLWQKLLFCACMRALVCLIFPSHQRSETADMVLGVPGRMWGGCSGRGEISSQHTIRGLPWFLKGMVRCNKVARAFFCPVEQKQPRRSRLLMPELNTQSLSGWVTELTHLFFSFCLTGPFLQTLPLLPCCFILYHVYTVLSFVFLFQSRFIFHYYIFSVASFKAPFVWCERWLVSDEEDEILEAEVPDRMRPLVPRHVFGPDVYIGWCGPHAVGRISFLCSVKTK